MLSTISGGLSNVATGMFSAVGGGFANLSAGAFSFTVGRGAQNVNAAHGGVFLFADSSIVPPFNSEFADEFAVRASGGVRLRTSANLSTGCNLPAGSGVFSCTSDANAKSGFASVDPDAVLKSVAAMPISFWVYKTDESAARHMGPTAQDFRAAFNLGTDDRSIGHIDADGVALAAIQGLYRKLQEQERAITQLHEAQSVQESLIKVLQEQNQLLRVRLDVVDRESGDHRIHSANYRP